MYDSWSCLGVTRGPGLISDEVRTALIVAASDLHLKHWEEMLIESDIISGVIETDWNSYAVGSRAGVLFRAHIDCEDGADYQVNFLLSEEDLALGAHEIRKVAEEHGLSVEYLPVRIPVPELYRFEDLRGPSRRRH